MPFSYADGMTIGDFNHDGHRDQALPDRFLAPEYRWVLTSID